MSRKIHLRRNKLTETNRPVASCAARDGVAGKMRRNTRSSYQFMSSPIVGLDEFIATPEADRCAHCVDMGLQWINRQAREKGRQPFANWAEFAEYRRALKK